MVEEAVMSEPVKGANRRNIGKKKKCSKGRKDPKMLERIGGKVKIDRRMKKLFRKRAREYNSDDDSGDDDECVTVIRDEDVISMGSNMEMGSGVSSEEEGEDGRDNEEDNEISEDGGIQPGITKLSEGCRAFKMAFTSIIKKSVSDEALGPVLSAHKKLVAEKLAEEEAE